MRRRKPGWRAAQAIWNDISRQLARAAKMSKERPGCGCQNSKPEADPAKWPCPCGSHCKDCKRE